MEVRWLEDFIALARTRHFSRAADMRHVSQPTFSRRIKLLEETAGTTLINRQTLPLTLTPAGEEFLQMCERVTRDVRATQERIENQKAAAASRICLGASQGLFSHFFPTWAESHGLTERLEPNLNSTQWVGEGVLDALANGECDIALCYWHESVNWDARLNDARYTWMTLGEEQLIPLSIVNKQDNAPRFPLPGSADEPLPFIAYNRRGALTAAISDHLAQTTPQAHLLPLNENIQASGVKALLKQGFGMSWLPRRMIGKSEQYGNLVRAGDEHWDVRVEIRLVRLTEPRSNDTVSLWNQLRASRFAPVNGKMAG